MSWGFAKGVASSYIVFHKQRQIQLYLHGDDFVAVASTSQVKWLQQQQSHAYDMKSNIMGDSKQDVKQQKILNRVVTWYDRSIEYEADPRHAEIIITRYGDEDNQPDIVLLLLGAVSYPLVALTSNILLRRLPSTCPALANVIGAWCINLPGIPSINLDLNMFLK